MRNALMFLKSSAKARLDFCNIRAKEKVVPRYTAGAQLS